MSHLKSRFSLQLILAGFLALLALQRSSIAASPQGLILCGSSGEDAYRTKFAGWSNRLHSVLIKAGFAESNIRILREPESGKPPDESSISLASIQSALENIAKMVTPQDDLFIFMIGHGSFINKETRFLIPGPDLNSAQLKSMLAPIKARRVIVIDSTASSAGFINELSGPNRIICTATKSVNEVNAANFMEYFIQGLEEGSADSNRDERISVLEACRQAGFLTEAGFQDRGLVPTEHCILDDNGDELGTRVLDISDSEKIASPDQAGKTAAEGALSANCFIKDFIFPPAVSSELSEKYIGLLSQIDDLKTKKGTMPVAEYMHKLEELLIDAAKVNREIHQRIEEADRVEKPAEVKGQ